MVAAIRETMAAVRALPGRQGIIWTDQDTANVEDVLKERADIRAEAAAR